ncbi:hypothetical protein [Streptomyces peucetius]
MSARGSLPERTYDSPAEVNKEVSRESQ